MLKHFLILVLVGEKSAHAYAIGVLYQHRFGRLAPLSRNSVYRILDVLAAGGLAEEVQIEHDLTVRVRHVPMANIRYRLTSAGGEALRWWIPSPERVEQWHSELVGRMAAAGVLGCVELLPDLITRYEQQSASEALELTQQMAELDDGMRPSAAVLARGLVLEERLSVLAAQARWVGSARKKLEQYGPGR